MILERSMATSNDGSGTEVVEARRTRKVCVQPST
jgi:hypothetical protein